MKTTLAKKHVPLPPTERERLLSLLRSNATTGAPVGMGRDTGFADPSDLSTDAINLIASVPNHY